MAIAAFPSVKPSARTWTPGARATSAFTSLSGYEVRVQHGSTAVGARLSLSFQNLTEAVSKQITDHFDLARGSFETFALPADVFSGMTGYEYITPSATTWRYAGPPSVTFVSPGIQSVSVELVAVPI